MILKYTLNLAKLKDPEILLEAFVIHLNVDLILLERLTVD